jgi:hypothetical protein
LDKKPMGKIMATCKKMKTRKQSLKSLIAQADRLLQLKFCSLHHFCIVCGKGNVIGHHYILKSQSNNTRFDLSNLVALCLQCHTRLHLSGDPIIIQTILKKKGMKWADELQKKRHIIQKLNKGFLRSIIEQLSNADNLCND